MAGCKTDFLCTLSRDFFQACLYYTVICLLRQTLLRLWLSNYNRQQNELRHFEVFLTSKGENIAFPPRSPPGNVVPLSELPIENNKHPNFEWRGQGRGVDSFGLWSYPKNLSAMSQQFCCWFYLRKVSSPGEWKKTWRTADGLKNSRCLYQGHIQSIYGTVESILIHHSIYLATWQTSWYPLITLRMCTLHFG